MAKRKQYDWEAIEREYRAGALSIREIARQHGCSDPAIIKRAKKHGWKRDLTEKVRKQVSAKLVSTEVSTANVSEDEIVDAAAKRGVEVVRSHRKLIGNTINLAERLINEAKEQKLDAKNHSALFRTISQGLAKVIPLERQAFNLDDRGAVETIERVLEAVHGS